MSESIGLFVLLTMVKIPDALVYRSAGIDVDIHFNIRDFRLCGEFVLFVFLFEISTNLFIFFIRAINV